MIPDPLAQACGSKVMPRNIWIPSFGPSVNGEKGALG